MADPATLFALAAAGTLAVAIAAGAALKGWQDWLELRRLEIERSHGRRSAVPARLEMADLKDRVRRLEAIASGTDT
ncbi:hypothetical protein RCO27_05110 [Sphingosinicella sp. LHD-64]|uniref:hypothetical protein n=1 Tax=Sphingosinicella sp. LHD-64 TaxID=3072139 RepID=UPI00281021F5|nr:hypothetical protein [Sphingosinicella sp. LHD-64]MDQ8755601.1 hypothetical protein [Sphingosinicella sp. LHD-64]